MNHPSIKNFSLPTLEVLEKPVKALFTAIIIVMSLGMAGALSQVIVHDIIPTFIDKKSVSSLMPESHQGMEMEMPSHQQDSSRDMFSDMAPVKEKKTLKTPYYKEEQFVWLLKWTHIHIFSMSMIFIFMGIIAIFLNVSTSKRNLLIVLPFMGILIDILAMWLKIYVSPRFFWLHIPGGGLFVISFTIVSLKALSEMWLPIKKGRG